MPRCPVCGRDPADCQDPAKQFSWQVGEPIRCHATTALREQQKRYTEDQNAHLDALLFPVRLIETTNARRT